VRSLQKKVLAILGHRIKPDIFALN